MDKRKEGVEKEEKNVEYRGSIEFGRRNKRETR